MKKPIAIIAALLCLTACATTDPQPVKTAPETDTTAAAETQQETETETEPETETAPVSDAQIQYDNITMWESSTGTLWYTAVVEVANLGETTIQLSSCTLDVEGETAATIAALQAAMEILREQLDAKDAIIADKDAQIRTMSDRLADLAARGNEIADKSIVALQQRHMLDAAEMQQSAEQPEERKPWWKRIGKKS